MDSELLTRLQSFSLCEAEDKGFRLDLTDVKASKEECKQSLIGKLHGSKTANITGISNTFASIWTGIGPFRVRELGSNLFQFIFASQHDKLRILNSKTWTFEGQFLLLKPFTDEPDLLTQAFNRVHVWIQVWNLPLQWTTQETGFRFKHLFGNVIDVLIPEGGSKQGRHIKILAELDLDKPLLRGTKLSFEEHTVWVSFKYEKMATFCFYCGLVGHSEKTCTTRLADAKKGTIVAGQYGDWLKAAVVKPVPKASSPFSHSKLDSAP